MEYKIIKKRYFGVIFILVICCICYIGCGSSDGTTSDDDDDFAVTTDLQGREDALKLLFTEAMYNTVTKESRNNASCKESSREALGLSELPNGECYYTYDNMIAGMAKMEDFASEGGENTNKLEIAAFLANVAQESGGGQDVDPSYGGPGCYIQEIGKYGSTDYNSSACGVSYTCAAAGYFGRGPHQLSWDSNYKSFSEAMGVGSAYLTDPDILTTNPAIGIAGSIWFWGHEVKDSSYPTDIPYKPSAHNVIVGKWTPTEYDITCGRTAAGLGIITNIINGGLECGDRSTEVGRVNAQKRATYFTNIAAALGATVPDGWADSCTGQKDFEECPSYMDPAKRCGTSWADANAKCGTYCTINSHCSGGEACYAGLSLTPCQ